MLKVMVACGNGMGSSMLIKMKVESIFKEHHVDAEIDHTSVGDATSSASNYDVVLCPLSFESSFNHGGTTKIVGLQNVLSGEEITDKLKKAGIL